MHVCMQPPVPGWTEPCVGVLKAGYAWSGGRAGFAHIVIQCRRLGSKFHPDLPSAYEGMFTRRSIQHILFSSF